MSEKQRTNDVKDEIVSAGKVALSRRAITDLIAREYTDEHLKSMAEKAGLTADALRDVLTREGSVTRAAASFGISRTELVEWMGSAVGMGDEVAGVLEEEYGIVTGAARRYGIKRWEMTDVVRRSQLLQFAIVNGQEYRLDVLEMKLMELAMAAGPQSTTPVIFALKTIGRWRGYNEASIRVDFGKMTDEQLERTLERIRSGEDPVTAMDDVERSSVKVKIG